MDRASFNLEEEKERFVLGYLLVKMRSIQNCCVVAISKCGSCLVQFKRKQHVMNVFCLGFFLAGKGEIYSQLC